MYRILALVFALVVPLAASAANEARCAAVDLMSGGHCDCSEPYNTATPSTAGLSNGNWNPGDTSAKECAPFEGVYGYEFYPVDATANRPPGTSIANFLELNMVPGSASSTHSTKAFPREDLINGSSTRKRVCWRMYANFDANWEGGGAAAGSCKNKFLSSTNSNGTALLAIEDSVASNNNKGILRIARSSWSGIADKTLPNYDDYTQAQRDTYPSSSYCKGDIWCGMEFCMAGNLAQGTGIKAEFYTWTTDGAKEFTETAVLGTAGVNSPVQPPNWRPWMPNLYRQKDPGPCVGKRRISHFMQATWDQDLGQRIGKATEMEPPPAADDEVDCEP